MHQTTRLADLVHERLTDTIAAHRLSLQDLGDDCTPLLDEALGFLQGGKRLRAQFLVLGYRCVAPLDVTDTPPRSEASIVLDAACALELFHAAALIHDDIIDNSDTRRARPSAHRYFAALHHAHGLRGSAERFGLAGAILLGDLLQSWADELMQRALDLIPDRAAAHRARTHFNQMRSEVAMGQYLDVLEEQRAEFTADQLERSTRVLIYKSAKYSVQAPLLIGAALAGASAGQEQSLADFGLPVGVAFQLRDDQLGVFGDESLTGKPTGGDLREGKRTVLVTLAREQLPAGPKRVFDDLHGTADLDREQIAMLQRTIRETGAPERVERMIASNIGKARETIREASVHEDAALELIALAEYAARRDA